MNISFDKSLKGQFMASQNLTSDSSGYLFDDAEKKRVLDESSRPIKTKDFAGFRKGSKIYLSKNIDTVIHEATLDGKLKKKPKK